MKYTHTDKAKINYSIAQKRAKDHKRYKRFGDSPYRPEVIQKANIKRKKTWMSKLYFPKSRLQRLSVLYRIGIYESIKGTHKNKNMIPYTNEFQQKVFASLDRNPTISSWKYRPDLIEYGDEKFVVLDVLTTDTSGKQKIIMLRKDGINKHFPLKLIEDYCVKNNYDFGIFTSQDII